MVRRKQTTSRVANDTVVAHSGLSRRRQKALAAYTVAATPFIWPVGAGCPAIAMGRSLGQVQCLCEGDCHVTTFRGKAAGKIIYCLLQVGLACKAAEIRLNQVVSF